MALDQGLALLPPQAQMVIGLASGLLGPLCVSTSPTAMLMNSAMDKIMVSGVLNPRRSRA